MQGSIAVVMGFGVANRVLYKMALNPLSDYVFFLAQYAFLIRSEEKRMIIIGE